MSEPPGISWSAYSDSALLQSIKTIATELQARAAARAAAGVGQSWDAITDVPAASPGVAQRAIADNEKAVEKPIQEWY